MPGRGHIVAAVRLELVQRSIDAVVKVRGLGGLSPLLRFESPLQEYKPPDLIDKVLFYAQITPN